MKHLLVAAILSGILLAPLAVRAVDAPACTARGPLPDATCTPGATNPQVTQATIGETICVRDYTATIRPPATYTTALKARQLGEYGLTGPLSAYEEDHRVPLGSGGHPSDPENLYPEEWVRTDGFGAHTKDVLEARVQRQICDGEISLADAQAVWMGDWTVAYVETFGLPVTSNPADADARSTANTGRGRYDDGP